MDSFDLFEPTGATLRLGNDAVVLREFALGRVGELFPAIVAVEAASPLRRMVTPGGLTMSVASTNCGMLGWVSDQRGYRYTSVDPETRKPWPAMPDVFASLATLAAAEAGFPGFEPDACLINHYAPGARMSLHQDKNERDFGAPIVSVSLGLSATFLFGGHERTDRAARVSLHHGDVVVWGGADRLRYHGIMPLKSAQHPLTGTERINLTFRMAG
ncbi:DNA oxidative demethylase AlkB [Luteibacter sp.]|uniref:DNA oxidative demethylase AlkB n=1 Tax=Luteibacter sp. TaxID=1886636 RepID=UPI003F7FD03C